MTEPWIEVRNVSKAFGGVQALRCVSLDIAAGEVHALCGENGAGKSTLIKVLAGSVRPDAGEVVVRGQRLPLGDVRASETAGLAVIHQESVAFPHLSTPENIGVGREPRRWGGWELNRAQMRQHAQALLDQLGERFDPRVPVGELTVAQRRMVAIARALSRECRLLIMDEPTASLSAREADVLFGIIRQLQAQGVSILYVSHRLEEVLALGTRVTVLRDGQLVGTRSINEVDQAALVRMMVGRELLTERGMAGTPGATLLEVRGLTRRGAFSDVSFTVRAGEVVGMGGLVGAGRSEVARTLFGIDRPDDGTVTIGGRPLPPGSVPAALEHGLALVPEDRQHMGLVLPMSVGNNLTLAVQRQLARWGFTSAVRERPVIERVLHELDVRAASPWVPANTLSGGNQQKVVLGKWLAASPRVLVLDEPTRGVDVGAKAEVHRLIRELAAKGMATLLISSELPELLALSDRILVMRGGRIVVELPRSEATEERVLTAALGVVEPAREGLPPTHRQTEPEARARGSSQATPTGHVLRSRSGLPSAGDAPEKRTSAFTTLIRRREAAVAALLLLTVLAVSAINPKFIAPGNVRDVLVQCVPAAIVGCGVTLVIVTGEIDISVGSLMYLLAVVMGLLTSPTRAGLPVPLGLCATLVLGVTVGLINGVLVTFARVPSIIATLGMLTALRGAAEMLMGGQWIVDLPPGVRFFGVERLLAVPVSIWVAAVVVAAAIVLARLTPLGLRIYAVGSNAEAARLAGLSQTRLKLFVFAFTGFLVGVATIVSVPQLSTIEASIGSGFELLVVTCVVVGGTSISGGQGSITGSLLAALLLGSLRTDLIFMKLGVMSTYWERAIQGAFILVAVLLDQIARRRAPAEARS